MLPHTRQSGETMTHMLLTPTQSVGSARPQRNRTQDLSTRCRALCRLSHRAPVVGEFKVKLVKYLIPKVLHFSLNKQREKLQLKTIKLIRNLCHFPSFKKIIRKSNLKISTTACKIHFFSKSSLRNNLCFPEFVQSEPQQPY